MNTRERKQLLAERTALERMLTGLPESSVIDRMSLEARKAKVEKELSVRKSKMVLDKSKNRGIIKA